MHRTERFQKYARGHVRHGGGSSSFVGYNITELNLENKLYSSHLKKQVTGAKQNKCF